MTSNQHDWGAIGAAVLTAVRAQVVSWQNEGFLVEVHEPGRFGAAISLWCRGRAGMGHLSVWSSGLADAMVGAQEGGHGEPEVRSFTVGSVSDIRDALEYFERSIMSYD
jgi:hypothetical protein